MEDTVIRPTMKFIKIGYVLVFLVIVAAVIGYSMIPADSEWKDRPWILLAHPAACPAELHQRHHLRRQAAL
jgi:hypothetical protein